jgi:hypothetical protein
MQSKGGKKKNSENSPVQFQQAAEFEISRNEPGKIFQLIRLQDLCHCTPLARKC